MAMIAMVFAMRDAPLVVRDKDEGMDDVANKVVHFSGVAKALVPAIVTNAKMAP
jgi:hypothetical protein